MTADTYRIVVIDDLRNPEPGTGGIEVEVYRTPQEGLAALQEYQRSGVEVEELWLDHDMGISDDDKDMDIWPVVNWLEELAHNGTPLQVGLVFIHTSNPAGRERMMHALWKKYNIMVAELPVVKGY